MHGEFVGVWAETWREIWLPLIEQPLAEDDEGLHEDIFCELYRALAPALSPRPSVEDLAAVISSPKRSSNSRTRRRPASDVMRDPWNATFKKPLKAN